VPQFSYTTYAWLFQHGSGQHRTGAVVGVTDSLDSGRVPLKIAIPAIIEHIWEQSLGTMAGAAAEAYLLSDTDDNTPIEFPKLAERTRQLRAHFSAEEDVEGSDGQYLKQLSTLTANMSASYPRFFGPIVEQRLSSALPMAIIAVARCWDAISKVAETLMEQSTLSFAEVGDLIQSIEEQP
jgi:hypothetical protein